MVSIPFFTLCPCRPLTFISGRFQRLSGPSLVGPSGSATTAGFSNPSRRAWGKYSMKRRNGIVLPACLPLPSGLVVVDHGSFPVIPAGRSREARNACTKKFSWKMATWQLRHFRVVALPISPGARFYLMSNNAAGTWEGKDQFPPVTDADLQAGGAPCRNPCRAPWAEGPGERGAAKKRRAGPTCRP